MRKVLGRYIVKDTSICHGELTFRGTRIFVKDVLEQVASGMPWEAIEEEWRGSVNKSAIAEAVRLASEALIDNADKYARETDSEKQVTDFLTVARALAEDLGSEFSAENPSALVGRGDNWFCKP